MKEHVRTAGFEALAVGDPGRTRPLALARRRLAGPGGLGNARAASYAARTTPGEIPPHVEPATGNDTP